MRQGPSVEKGVRHSLTLQLHRSCLFNPFCHGRAVFSPHLAPSQDLGRRSQYRDMQIDSIQQWPGHLVAIGNDSIATATTVRFLITEVTARTRVHCGDELESRREVGMGARPGDTHRTSLERFPQRLENRAIELGQLVHEQHAIVSPRDFAGRQQSTAADHCGGACRVMRRAKRPPSPGVA